MTTDPQTDRTTEFYDALVTFQNTHRLPGLQHAQIRGLLAEHLARTVPAAAPAAVPPTDRAGLRERIAGALVSWTYRGKEPDSETGILETVRANAYSRADAVLSVLPEPVDRAAEEQLGTQLDEAAETIANRTVQINRLTAERDSLGREADRLRKDWVEMRTRAETGRAAVLREAADAITAVIEADRAYSPRRSNDRAALGGAREIILGLIDDPSRLAAETPGPETQGGDDTARLAKVARWVTSEPVTANTEFGNGYRACQRDIRDLIKGRFDYDPRPTAPAVVAEPGKENGRG